MSKKICLGICFLLATGVSLAQDSLITADEFEEFTGDSIITSISSAGSTEIHKNSSPADIYWTLAILLLTAGASLLLRFKSTRQLRSMFLVLSIVTLGFYRGGCPCSIQSFQHGILSFTGSLVRWPSLLLFAALLPVTYFFGRVYCGWICQLGALQELIFKTSSIRIFQSERSQKIMRGIRILALFILISQLLITQTNLYRHIDPFAIIYNFYSEYYIGWILVTVIFISSFLMYRPFCKTICPVGLALGWISKIPGASVLGVKESCTPCTLCSKSCKINAITNDKKISILDNQECIRCGDCMNSCRKNAFTFYRRNQKHLSKIACKPFPPVIKMEQRST
jgi:polyferredoxin